MKKKITVKSLKEMELFARTVAQSLRGGEVLALTGELGAGKTAFTKALAKALGVKGIVQSPTFLVMKCYPLKPGAAGRMLRTICHVDAYRVKDERELSVIGLQENMADPQTVTVIEWADLVKGLIPARATWMEFSHGSSAEERVICLR